MIGFFDVSLTVLCVLAWYWPWAEKHQFLRTWAAWFLVISGLTSVPQIFIFTWDRNYGGLVGAFVWTAVGWWAAAKLWQRHQRSDLQP